MKETSDITQYLRPFDPIVAERELRERHDDTIKTLAAIENAKRISPELLHMMIVV